MSAALQQAADAKKHLFVFVHEKDDEQTRAGRKTFDTAVGKLGDAVQWIAIDRNAPSESEFVEKYGLKAAPMPLALSFAPNGAIIGGFFGARLTEQQLMDALASPGMQACLKALQDRKLVFLCAQNGTTKSNDTAMKGVNEFKADERFAQFTEIVKIDPSDAAEKKFLTQLQVDPKVDQATTVFLAPPGAIVGKFSGATDKDKLVATLQAASSGCGAGGCGPKRLRAQEVGDRAPCGSEPSSGGRSSSARTNWSRVSSRSSWGSASSFRSRTSPYYSEKAVARELDALGANILILPKSASLQDYYSSDMQEDVFPEEYVTRLANSDLQGLDNLSPKLSVPVELQGQAVHADGDTPQERVPGQGQLAGSRHLLSPAGLRRPLMFPAQPRRLPRKRWCASGSSTHWASNEALVGADVAASLGVKAGRHDPAPGQVLLRDRGPSRRRAPWTIRASSPICTRSRSWPARDSVVNAIEIVGCCNQISKGLVQKINQLLPEAKVVTITQIVDTQIKTNRMMSRLSVLFLGIIVLVGGASIANYMYANVFERRREIGTLMALGAGSSVVLRMFLLKALLLGLGGGIMGYVLGTVMAVVLGPGSPACRCSRSRGWRRWPSASPRPSPWSPATSPPGGPRELDPTSALQEI